MSSLNRFIASDDLSKTRRLECHDADVVVVGAGIFGCAVAVALGNQGRSVILLEKSLKEPDRIVGELLQPGGVAALEKLGLRDCLDGIDAIPVKGYDVIYHDQPVLIPYPEQSDGTTRRRPEGRSFHHGRLIQKLRQRATQNSNVMVVESTATGLITCGTSGDVLGVHAITNGTKDFYFGHLTIIADGYASKFRKSHLPYTPVSKSKFYGLELHDCPLPEPNHGHVVLGSNAPVLLYQIGTHETRVLIDVPENTPTAAYERGGVRGHLRDVVLPSLPISLQSSFEEALDRDTLIPRSMPNSWLPPSTNITPGLLLLGDAMNMRHPLTGGGMTVAFNDVVLLSELLHPQRVPVLSDSKLVLKQMKTFHWKRKNLTSVVNILAQALYSLFAANDNHLRSLQHGCFRYFQLGGQCIDGPVGLLAGIIRQPLVLVYHFFAVALLSMWLHICGESGLAPASASVQDKSASRIHKVEKDCIEHSETGHVNRYAKEFADGTPNGGMTFSVTSSKSYMRYRETGLSISQSTMKVLTAPVRMVTALAVFWKACVVIFPYIFSELRT